MLRVYPHISTRRALPPRAEVDVLVEITATHWYWLGDFWDDGIDRTPVFRWSVESENRGRYAVARLLWCWANNATSISPLYLEITCGLITCVNPAHVRRIGGPSHAMTLPSGCGARMRKSGVAVHIVRDDSTFAICGRNVPRVDAPLGATVTCRTCVLEWRARGNPLVPV